MKHLGTQRLETDRLILRRFTLKDIEPMYRNWASDDEVTKFLRWPTHSSVDVTTRLLSSWLDDYNRDDNYQWAIVLKDNGDEPIGSISVVEFKDKLALAHIGYCIGRPWWHKGITSEALQAVIKFMFDEVGVNKVESMHDPNNPNSGKVMKKCGMTYEGTLRSTDCSNQGICDASYYGILRNEWQERQ